MTTKTNTTKAHREEIAALLADNRRDWRYFDASDDGLARPTNAGEMVRYSAARRERAEALPASVSEAVREAVKLAVPDMTDREAVYTLQALRNCPAKRTEA